MSVEMPNGRLDCGVQGFPASLRRPQGRKKEKRPAGSAKGPFPRCAIFDILDIKNPKQ